MGSQMEQDPTFEGHREKWPRRTVRLQLDLLPAFETGDLHTCTIRVGCDLQDSNSIFRDFKCHKLVLAACSPVFETTFNGHFKEAKMGPDEPIQLDKIDPDVFESAMRFVYGQVKDFKTTAFGVKLYKFAQEMQIDTLKDELVEFFKETKSSEIFALFDFCFMSGNQTGLDNCKLILELETKEALASKDWLNISSESILEFLNMDCLDIKEADLVRALIRWGKFQTGQNGVDAVENLRSKILPGLQKIRFGSFTQLEVAQLCEGELKEVLTADEKYSILTSLITGDWKMMPTGVVSSSKLVPRNRGSYTFCPLPYYNVHQPQISKGSKISTQQMSLKFEVNRKAVIVGVKLDMNAHLHNTLTTISLYKSYHNDIGEKVYVSVGKGVPKSTTLYRGEMFCEINSKEKLAAGREYKMIFTFATSLGGDLGEFKTYSLPKDKNPSCSDGLALKISHESLKSFVHIQGFLFEKEGHPSS